MSEAPVDVMAGERARMIRANPESAQRVLDPTDPFAGTSKRERRRGDERDSTVREDPTDPRYGEPVV